MKCLTCEATIEGALYSISHTIKPGAKLCPDCGQRESMDPLWADGLRIGFARHEAATKSMEEVKRQIGENP